MNLRDAAKLGINLPTGSVVEGCDTSASNRVPGSMEEKLKPHSTPRVTLDIRPEHIPAHKPTDVGRVAVFTANKEAVEPMVTKC